jgi:hypothetical protein
MRLALALCIALLISSLQPAFAANQYSGTWNIQPSDRRGYVGLQMQYRNESPGNSETWSESNDVPLSQLSGLSAADLNSGGERKTFVIHRDAGDFQAEGWFARGHASGTWTFAPSQSFRSELARRGIASPDDRDQFRLAISGFSISTLDELNSAGFERPSVSDLVRMNEHGVDDKYIAAMRGVPLHPKTIDALIRMRDHGVSVDFVQGLQRLGYRPSADDLVRLADHGVSIAFIERMRSHGYTHLSADDLIRLRDHGF